MPELHEQLGCFGYYGFGSGYALAKFGKADDTSSLYCNRCPLATACWRAHRARVRAMFPSACELADEIMADLKFKQGGDYMKEWLKRTEQEGGGDVVEPYLGVMGGNVHDGGHVALTGAPHDRGTCSLSWPLVPITKEEE